MNLHSRRPPSAAGPDAAGDEQTSEFVRTYTLTKGRTRPRYLLGLDTVLEAGPGRPGPGQPEECGQIVALCRLRRRSVAELAGTIGRPVTPVMVLISDLLDADALVVPPVTAAYTTSPGSPDDPRPPRQLLEAVSVGLRKKWPDAVPYRRVG
ncbi:DUF742 domain-containing protein [Streptomyces sp. NPDC002845]